MKHQTACPLDCYDACSISYSNEKLDALKTGHTASFLCPHMNHYSNYETIQTPKYKGEEISLDKALLLLKSFLEESQKSEILHYRGNGNFGLMQEVTDHFFSSYGAILTDGSLCDGAGEAGIVEGRGSNKNMPLSEIAKSEVVIIWGRNPHATSSHLLPLLKNKTIIVIDPVKTKIAKEADLFIQIKPHSDLYLAMLLSRFLHIEGACDDEFLKKQANNFEDFYELTQSIRIKATLDNIDVSLGQIGELLERVKGKKTAIVCGIGIQKYKDGSDVMRAIDTFGVALGLFGKEGCGVAYMGDSKESITPIFNRKSKRISKVDTEFSNYKTVFIQSSNPVAQMPNSLRVIKSISKVKNLVYFGLYENETSDIADLIIPAKNFLCKNDVRTSYSHNSMMIMSKIQDSKIGISEYDLSKYLCKEFSVELEEEKFYLEYFKNFSVQKLDASWHVQNREEVPYKDGFDTADGEFTYMEEFEEQDNANEKLFLITPKYHKSLNSQFSRSKNVHINSSHGFKDGELVVISSACGDVKLSIKVDDNVREDCVVIYSGTQGVNNLTSSKHSYEGKNAIYQEEKVKVTSFI